MSWIWYKTQLPQLKIIKKKKLKILKGSMRKKLSLNISEVLCFDWGGYWGDRFCCLIYYCVTLKLSQEGNQMASSKWQMTEMAFLKTESCVWRKKTWTRSKVNILSQETAEEYGCGNGGARSREDTYYIRQTDTVGCLRSLHLTVLKCWTDLKYDVATTYENWVNARAGREEGDFT